MEAGKNLELAQGLAEKAGDRTQLASVLGALGNLYIATGKLFNDSGKLRFVTDYHDGFAFHFPDHLPKPLETESLAVMEEDGRGRAVDLEDATRAAQVRFSLCDNDFCDRGSKTIFTAPRDPAVAACSMASR